LRKFYEFKKLGGVNMKVLLSIKPEYVKRIFDGKKRYEYRRSLFRREDVDTIIVYATKPVGKVIGEFKIDRILKENPIELWNQTKKYSGILKKDYMEYFREREQAFAIGIKNVYLYDEPLELKDINPNIKFAPQSFMYVDNEGN
jgi:predicted transcriptional regulator